MSMNVNDLRWQQSYNEVVHILPSLTERELNIIGDVARQFMSNPAVDRAIRARSEAELWARIDRSIQQADQGDVLELEDAVALIDREFGL